MSEGLVEFRGVVKCFNKATALAGIDLSLPEGTICGLMGPNGAGKTTLLRVLTRIYTPDKGTVRFMSQPVGLSTRRQIGYLPEERGLYKKMKVGEQMHYFARLRGLSAAAARDAVRHWSERLEISQWHHKKLQALSKGMAQKVQFAISVLHKPRLLILDEPFSGFDPLNTQIITREILELNREGMTLLLATHRMESIETLCQHITLINKGRKLLDGEIHALKNAHSERCYLLRYEMADKREDAKKQALIEALPTGYSLRTPDARAEKEAIIQVPVSYDLKDFFASLLAAGITPTHVEALLPSIADIFVNYVSKDQVVSGTNV